MNAGRMLQPQGAQHGPAGRATAGPPVYRPRPLPKVLQGNGPANSGPPASILKAGTSVPHEPLHLPAYAPLRPAAPVSTPLQIAQPTLVRRHAAAKRVGQPTAGPPVYRPQPLP